MSFGDPVSLLPNQHVTQMPNVQVENVSKTSPRLGRTPEDSGGLERTQMMAEGGAANRTAQNPGRDRLVRTRRARCRCFLEHNPFGLMHILALALPSVAWLHRWAA